MTSTSTFKFETITHTYKYAPNPNDRQKPKRQTIRHSETSLVDKNELVNNVMFKSDPTVEHDTSIVYMLSLAIFGLIDGDITLRPIARPESPQPKTQAIHVTNTTAITKDEQDINGIKLYFDNGSLFALVYSHLKEGSIVFDFVSEPIELHTIETPFVINIIAGLQDFATSVFSQLRGQHSKGMRVENNPIFDLFAFIVAFGLKFNSIAAVKKFIIRTVIIGERTPLPLVYTLLKEKNEAVESQLNKVLSPEYDFIHAQSKFDRSNPDQVVEKIVSYIHVPNVLGTKQFLTPSLVGKYFISKRAPSDNAITDVDLSFALDD